MKKVFRTRTTRDDFSQETKKVARWLLGKYLVTPEKRGKIMEVEAYLGTKDKAAHTYQGKKTKRNVVVYGEAGHLYVYLCYGLYWMLNITSGPSTGAECVLIRTLEPMDSLSSSSLLNGPGKLTRWLNVNHSFNGEDIVFGKKIWVENNPIKVTSLIKSSPRVGIDYAGEWTKKKLRYYIS